MYDRTEPTRFVCRGSKSKPKTSRADLDTCLILLSVMTVCFLTVISAVALLIKAKPYLIAFFGN